MTTKEYYQSHREQMLLARREYRRTHKELENQRGKIYRETHKEQRKITKRKWDDAHKDHNRAYRKQYDKKHPEKSREQSRRKIAKKPEKYRALHRVRQTNYRKKVPEKIKARWDAWYNVELDEVCVECGGKEGLARHHPDYSKPLFVQTLCRSCHTKKNSERSDFSEKENPIKTS